MKNKVFWIDVETTGLSHHKNDIIVMGINIEDTNGGILSEEIRMRPTRPENIQESALDVAHFTRKQVMAFPPASKGFKQLKAIMGEFINQYNPKEKFILAGYNLLKFDAMFLRELFTMQGDKYFGSWFYNTGLDVMSTVGEYVAITGDVPENFKLVTMCEHMGIKLGKAHSADEDIAATRELYYKLKAAMR